MVLEPVTGLVKLPRHADQLERNPTQRDQFSRDWAGVKSERAEAQTFWNEFFKVFGVRRRTVATFEEAG